MVRVIRFLFYSKRKDTLFNELPLDIIQKISDYGQDPNNEICKALHYAAYARKEDVDALLAMLETNPSLLQAGNVKTPDGDEVRRITIYEFLLGAGDFELAKKVQPYFTKIKNGEQERLRQYERYKPHIDRMLKQQPYNLAPLIELIKKASPEEITALLYKEPTDETELGRAMLKFRKDWSPRVIRKPGMHYNYSSLNHAIKLLLDEWKTLYEASGNNDDKINLVWRQLIGFEMRRLPGIDRCVMAQGLYNVVEWGAAIARTYKFGSDLTGAEFPVTDSNDSIEWLGSDFAVTMFGSFTHFVAAGWWAGSRGQCERTYVEQKALRLQNLGSDIQPSNNERPSPHDEDNF
ncbi:hypothetical protein [Legionella gresilensis]|uniref:hypothetical protein n=1 Tax=Legionella gresilensis TaxID=91823 RepID=UPI001041A61A|nr:hypothetical protein [Legionella gresilensis]